MLKNGCNTIYCTISNKLAVGSNSEIAFLDRKVRRYFWPWLVLSLADAVIFFAQKSLEF